MKDTASKYIMAGLNPIPFMDNESRPKGIWSQYQKERVSDMSIFHGVKSIGAVCGKISGGLEVVDVDCKYDLTGHLWEAYKEMLMENVPQTFKKLVIAKTKNNGIHLFYRCDEIDGNRMLARRETTEQERQKAPNEKYKVLIETRGEGGVITMPPTSGYEFMQGGVEDIPTISAEVRGYILHIAEGLTEVHEPEPEPIKTPVPDPINNYTQTGLTPWEDYNQRGDVLGLLERHGWKIAGQRGDRVLLLRPGKSDKKSSANFHTKLRMLKVWSSSTEFDPSKSAYNPTQVYATLEHGGDYSKAASELLRQGYGEPPIRKDTPKEKAPVDFTPVLKDVSPTIEEMFAHYSKLSDGLRTGYTIAGEDLILPSAALTGIAGATSHGKTALLINLCLNAVMQQPDQHFYFFSYEMSQQDIVCRFINSYLYHNDFTYDLQRSSNIKGIKSYFQEGNTKYIAAEARDMFEDKVKRFFAEMINTGRLRIRGVDYYAAELCQLITQAKKEGDVGGVFVDYFQLLSLPSDMKRSSRQEELKGICIDLNETAKNTGTPVILGAQFNRTMVNPIEMHPTQLGEAGDIERILNLLLGIWNTSYMPKDMGKDRKLAEQLGLIAGDQPNPGKMYVKVLKNREGEANISDLLEYDGKRDYIKTNKEVSPF